MIQQYPFSDLILPDLSKRATLSSLGARTFSPASKSGSFETSKVAVTGTPLQAIEAVLDMLCGGKQKQDRKDTRQPRFGVRGVRGPHLLGHLLHATPIELLSSLKPEGLLKLQLTLLLRVQDDTKPEEEIRGLV